MARFCSRGIVVGTGDSRALCLAKAEREVSRVLDHLTLTHRESARLSLTHPPPHSSSHLLKDRHANQSCPKGFWIELHRLSL